MILIKSITDLKLQLTPELQEMTDIVIADPGMDVHPDDTDQWMNLFYQAEKIDRELYAKLFYIRAGGAKLIRHSKFGYVIQPVLSGDWTQAVYDRERQCLLPYRGKIIELLGGLK